MKKIKIISLVMIMLTFCTSISTADTNKNIAIGLKFGSTSVDSATFKSNGLTVSNDINSKNISSDKTFTAKPLTIYVSDETYNEKNSEDFMYSDDLSTYKSASTSSKYKNQISSIAIYDSKNKIVFATSSKSDLLFSSNDATPFEIFGKKYRGGLKFINNSSSLTVINYLPIEEYLLGVVPNEMISSWNIEALKAQAIAARGFAYSNYNKFAKYGFNLTDDTRSQAYKGASSEEQSTTKAVNDTKGIIGYYKGGVAELIYNASSGGKTESAKNVWGSEIPYLIGQTDEYSLNNEYSNWTFTMSAKEIENALKNQGKAIGTLQKIIIDEISPSGYILKITFVGSSSKATFSKDGIRASLGYGKLKSLNFGINNSNVSKNTIELFDKTDEYITQKYYKPSEQTREVSASSYTFVGNGFGHGVGMSQYGAKQMADRGFNYKQILEFYYPHVEFR